MGKHPTSAGTGQHRRLLPALLLIAATALPLSAQETASHKDPYGPRAAAAPSRTTLAYPQSLFVDALHGQIWVADFDNNRVLRYDVASLTGAPEQPRARTAEHVALQQNFPNPFNPGTRITFTLPTTEYATLTVFDLLGREVMTLFAGIATAHAPYTVSVSARDLPSGIYFYALRSASRYEVKTMSVVK